jgi:hypothetical protein
VGGLSHIKKNVLEFGLFVVQLLLQANGDGAERRGGRSREIIWRNPEFLDLSQNAVPEVAVAQLVESRIVIPVVVGSSPISHPKEFLRNQPLRAAFFLSVDFAMVT